MPQAQPAAAARNEPGRAAFARFFWRVTACHTVTYFVAGVIAYFAFDYRALFGTGPLAQFVKPMDSPWIAAGPGLQVVRGLVFALALYPFRRVFLDVSRGWLKLWGLLVGLAILSTAGASPGSIEGFFYTRLPLSAHLRGLPEVLGQTAAFSALLVAWYGTPRRAWNVLMGVGVGIVMFTSAAALFLPRPDGFR